LFGVGFGVGDPHVVGVVEADRAAAGNEALAVLADAGVAVAAGDA
jgi:hypothetical protein